MGREAYLMRLALGRSALEPPENDGTPSTSRYGEQTFAFSSTGAPGLLPEQGAPNPNQPPPPDTQLYDARGHPFNPWARSRSRKLREAQNDILSVIGVTERKIPVDDMYGPDGLPYHDSTHEIDPEENDVGDYIGTLSDFDYQFMSWWIHALTNRLLVFPPVEDLSFLELVRLQWRGLGWSGFLFSGLTPFMMGHLVSPEIWTGKLLYLLDRAVFSSVSSKRWRDAYDDARFIIAGGIEVALNIFVLPFRLHSMLQLFGFQPSGTYIGLPHPGSWLPFCGSSLLQLNSSVLPILPFFLFRPISSLVHQYMFMSLRPAIMGPLDLGHRRRSSSSRYAPSVNAAPLLELPTDPTALTGVFQRVFGFLRWAPPRLDQDKPDLAFHPGLRRQETWPLDHQSTLNAPHSHHSDIDEPAPESPVPASTEAEPQIPPMTPPPPPLTRMNTVATLDGTPNPDDTSHDHATDATIRVASIDPDTGAVNLEIGLPDESIFEHEVLATATEETSLTPSRSARERSEMELFAKPHHVSRLALEPTELLASLANGWVAGWALMPLRAWVLRGLVTQVLTKPAMFGVASIRAAELPALLGSSAQVVLGGGGLWQEGLKHVGFSCMLDVGLGLGYWLVEWGVVRFMGVNGFGWGTF